MKKGLKEKNIRVFIQIIALHAILLVSSVASAQSSWSLQDCIDHALENNLDIRQQKLNEERAEENVLQSYSMTLPTLSAGTSYGLNFGRSIDEVTNEFFTERIASQRLIATSSFHLFAGFRTINNIRLNLARQTALRYDTESLENDLILTIANAYLQILYFEDMVEAARQQVEISTQQVERTRVLFEGGTVSRGDLLEVEAMAAEEEVRLTSMTNNLKLSYLELIYLLELDPDKEFAIMKPPLDVEDAQLMHDPDVIVEKALNTEPSVSAARQRISVAENGLAVTRGQRWPTLTLNTALGTAYSEAYKRMAENNNINTLAAGINGMSPDLGTIKNGGMPDLEIVPYSEQLSENYYRSIQLSLSIPIFNHLNARNNIQHARIDLEQARIDHERTRNNLSRVVYQAHADAVAAFQDYVSNQKALDAAQESFQYSEQGFALGLVSPLEYNEARTRLNRAEINAIQSMYEFVFKTKILEFYQGEGFVL